MIYLSAILRIVLLMYFSFAVINMDEDSAVV